MASLNLETVHQFAPPAVVGGNIVVAFLFAEFYSERRHRLEFLKYWSGTNSNRKLEPGEEAATLASFLNFLKRHATRYALAVFFVLLALALRGMLTPVLQDRLPFTFFLVPVILASRMGGTWKALLALILGYFAGTWFFAQPRSLVVSESYDYWAAALYMTIGAAAVWLLKGDKGNWLRTFRSDLAASKQMQAVRVKHATQADEMRELLAGIVQGAGDAIFSLTPQGRITTWNAAAEQLFAMPAWEAIGQPLGLVLPADQQPEAQQRLEPVLRGEPAQSWAATLQAKAGRSIAAVLTVSPIKDATGKPVGASVIVRVSLPVAGT
jgi:PAS domain S-box-containing protein